MSAYVLILDDDADVATAAQLLLRRRYTQVATLCDPAGLLRCWRAACRMWCCWI
jgi:FixJ family two-component response regulator